MNAGIYWRMFWLLPLPMIAGLAILAPLSAKFSRFPLKWRYTGYGLLLLLVLWPISEQNIFAPDNRVTLKFPGLKVPPEYQVAQIISDLFGDRPNVLVPAESVGAWLPTFAQHPYPLVSRLIHTTSLGDERRERVLLTIYIMGLKRFDDSPELLRNGLQKYQIRAVCFQQPHPWQTELVAILSNAGFIRQVEMLSYEIWLKR